MSNYNFLVLGFVVAVVLLVPIMTTDAFADYAFVHSIGDGDNYGESCAVPSGFCIFNSPIAIAVDQSQYVYVSDFYRNKISKFDSNGNFILDWGLPASNPYGIDVDNSGNVIVALRSTGEIIKFSSTGQFISQFTISGNPYWISVDNVGNTYVVKYANKVVEKYDSSGNLLYQLNNPDISNYPYYTPQGITTDESDNVYVSIQAGILKYDSSGNFVSQVASGIHYGIAIDPTTGNVIGVNNVPTSIPGWPDEYWSGDPLENCHQDLGYFGDCYPPNLINGAIAIDDNGYVYVSDATNGRVIKLSYVEPVQGPFTINYFEIFEESGHTRFKAGGDMPEPHSQRNMSYLITDSNGNVTYEYLSTTTTNGETYGVDAPVFYTSTSWNSAGQGTGGDYTQEYDGDFTLKICAPEIDQCMEKEFTISKMSGPFTITDDSTGGDCTSIGDWSSATKTCTLSNNLAGPIIIGSNDVTLDGNAKSITGTYTSLNPSASTFTEGVKMDGVTGVTIKNIIINNVRSGIYLSYSENNVIQDNTLSNNGYGVNLYNSPSNTIT